MSVLRSVIKWARQDLVPWQGDAVRRLLTQEALSDGDKAELLGMLKRRHGLGDPCSPVPEARPPTEREISGAATPASRITLHAIDDLRGVNALRDGGRLPFAPKGLTVIYGENASGKSGYVRVLKRACSARDTKERILPNVFSRSGTVPAQAVFSLSEDDVPVPVPWQDGGATPDILASVCVFDSRCARVIVDENNEVVYLPYGAQAFEGLATVLREIRATLESEKPVPKAPEFPDIDQETVAWRFLSKLSKDTPADEVRAMTSWEKRDEQRLTKMLRQLALAEAGDPLKEASRLETVVKRTQRLSQSLIQMALAVSEQVADGLWKEVNRFNAAREALSVVSRESLANEPLPGVGGDTWQRLYEAAREYTVREAYPDEEFPYTGGDSRCVLCMQRLRDDAKARLLRFKNFMEQTAKTDMDSARSDLERILEKLKGADLKILETYGDALEEVRARNEELAQRVEEFCRVCATRARQMVGPGVEKRVAQLPLLPKSPSEDVEAIAQSVASKAKETRESAKPEEFLRLKRKVAEERARRQLTKRRAEIEKYVQDLATEDTYRRVIDETDTARISHKGRQVVAKALTSRLVEALRNEIRVLGAEHLPLSLRPSARKGETLHKMELTDASRAETAKLTDILSEGEQHVVAIAGFLAELGVAGHQFPIVLDDPVCSLDHRYREKVAERLAREAGVRQVIVFTHDIAFVLELVEKAHLFGHHCVVQTVERSDGVPGERRPGLPWYAMSVEGRVKGLREDLEKIRGLHRTRPGAYNKEAALLYGRLRETWEGVVEKGVLNETVARYRSGVRTKNLSSVEVTDQTYQAIQTAYAKCSKWMLGHERSEALDHNLPSPDEIEGDIRTLDEFFREIRTENNKRREKRTAALKPKIEELA